MDAVGEGNLADLLRKRDWSLVAAFKMMYIDLLRKYYYVGRMPEAVNDYARHKDYKAVRKIHEQIFFTYDQDFSKHAPTPIVPRIRNLCRVFLRSWQGKTRSFRRELCIRGCN